MRVLVAPDGFGGTLTALQAAEAIAVGWLRARDDELSLVPLSDGGPGLLDALSAAVEGQLNTVEVTSPTGVPVDAQFFVVGETGYVESAQACGLHLVPPGERDALTATTWGVGQLILAALNAGARRIVVGLGGSATTDGGAGMLAALGAEIVPGDLVGGGALGDVREVDLNGLDPRLREVELVAATDVDNPLLGETGAAVVFGPQKGASARNVQVLDLALRNWAEVVPAQPGLTHRPGAGAAGGLGFALFVLGAQRRSGIEMVMEEVGFSERLANADLVISGEGSFDGQSLRGKAVSGVAAAAVAMGVPCLVLAGQVRMAPEASEAVGVTAAYAVADVAGSIEAALAAPGERLSDLAQHVGRYHCPRPPTGAPRPIATSIGDHQGRPR